MLDRPFALLFFRLSGRALAWKPVPEGPRVYEPDTMQAEFDALIANDTWCLVPRPPGVNLVTDKWIYRHKLLAGSLDRYNACWVLRGFTQWPNIDYDETFSSVVKLATVRVVLSLALSQN